MAFKFNRSSKEPMSEINVTPFVDVMLVLLIIFMVTMEQSLPLSLAIQLSCYKQLRGLRVTQQLLRPT